jgi:hypothetical protein
MLERIDDRSELYIHHKCIDNALQAVREVLGMHLTIQNALIQELHDAAIATEILAEPSSLLKAVAALRPKGPISTRV